MAREHKTSDGLLAISAGALLLALAIAWAAMPWPGAMIAQGAKTAAAQEAPR
ncbi:MAG: hypothetical protein ACK4ST_02565 [Elioraea tepidiphila]|jgi:hypothetical protein